MVVAVALVLYALVDAAMSDPARARGVSKPVWVVMIVVLPVIGAVLWLAIGKARGPVPTPTSAPDDDPRFTATRLSASELDAHVEELEARLRELDDEVFPEVDLGGRGGAAEAGGASSRGKESGRETNGNAEPGSSTKPESDASGEQR